MGMIKIYEVERGKVKRLSIQKWAMRSVMLVLAAAILAFSFVLPVSKANAAVAIELEAASYILMEASTGQIIYAKNADEALPPASMTKMMTEYVVMEHISDGKIKWDDIVTISQYANDVIGSGALLATDEKYTVKELFQNMSIYSGNDASVALAEFVAGTEENFVHMMNDKAEELGMTNSHFTNATGLSTEDLGAYAPNIPGETLMTAHDAALLARAIVTEHPEVLDIASQPTKRSRDNDETSPLMVNWNWMLEGWESYNNNFTPYAYKGLDGLKTGHTQEAGYCFTGTAERDGFRIISVVMKTDSERKRFEETRKLLDFGFNNFELKTVLAAKTELEALPMVSVKKGVETEVPVVTQEGVTLVVEKGAKEEEFVLTAESKPIEDIVAPIKQGDVLGTATLTYDGPIGKIEKEINMVAAQDVEKGSWIRLLFRAIGNFFGDIFDGIKNLF
jgi:D-alanyl-D-alanine carboxypeptidase (penicillin-binding protein 5/6)